MNSSRPAGTSAESRPEVAACSRAKVEMEVHFNHESRTVVAVPPECTRDKTNAEPNFNLREAYFVLSYIGILLAIFLHHYVKPK